MRTNISNKTSTPKYLRLNGKQRFMGKEGLKQSGPILLAWQSTSVGKKWKRVWMAAPLCIFWTLWLERNRVVFENEAPSAHRMKSFFLFTLWSWTKLYSVDNLNSLVGFLSWMG